MGVEVRSHRGPEKDVLKFPVERIEISKLVPHEQTIPHELDWFIKNVKDSEHLVWPLLVGRENFLILDGHHRAAGLKSLDYTYVPAILIDYMDDELIQLDTWYPNIHHQVAVVLEKLQEADLVIEDIDPSEFDRNRLNTRNITAFVGNTTQLYAIRGERERIFSVLKEHWIDDITYYDDPQMCMERTDTEHTAVVAWSYTKEEILQQVKAGMVHLPKTTRHTLKYRVPECNYPLEDLK